MGCITQAICHFWNGQQTFERLECVHLQQEVICLYIFEYSFIIMLNGVKFTVPKWRTHQMFLEQLNREPITTTTAISEELHSLMEE